MKKKIEIYQIDAFTNQPFRGNSAGVTIAGELTKDEMQSIANEMNLAETAFLSKPASSNKADYILRWFTPKTEVNLCGHATIASLHFLKEHNLLKNGSVRFETLSGILNCGSKDGKYFMEIPVSSMGKFNGNKEEIMKTVGIEKSTIDEFVPFILLDNKNLYIYVRNLFALQALRPDFNSLSKLTETKHEFEGVVVFTLETFEKENFAHSRYFVPYYGINEDPVTGSTNGPLMLVLQELGFVKKSDEDITLTFEQGDFIGRAGRVTVSHSSSRNELYISGNAVTVLKGEIIF
jgi:trans-2,3-dihydro-3-hydroxyanthranilate isomerase